VQVSVDGLRAIAERTGKYDGQDEPEYELGDKGLIISCKVKVYRKDWSRPAVGVAYWDEYVQTKKDGAVTRFWASMPRVMIAKCAEAIAMRKAFPEDMSGLYVEEEMQQTENDRPQLSHSPHTAPGESLDEVPRDSPEYGAIMAELARVEKEMADTRTVTWDHVCAWRGTIGDKSKLSALGQRISTLYQSDELAPIQKADMSKFAQRVNRSLKRLEGIVPKPSVEASFEDKPEREPGQDDEGEI
jgi:hypothetical protein